MPSALAVVKVGGSLYDLPDLGARLRRWLAAELADCRVVLVPGGGPVVDAIRRLDRVHGLGEEASHWLALRALSVNAHLLAALLPPSCVCGDVGELGRIWDNGKLPILDVYEFARGDEERAGRLPHCWAVSSDSLAARVALVLEARYLVLLKSTTIPQGVDWTKAARQGLVDEMLGEMLRDAPAELRLSAVNLRASAV